MHAIQSHTESFDAAHLKDAKIDFTRILNMQTVEMDNAIRHADLKAQLILGVDAILLAAVANFPLDEFGLILDSGVPIIERGLLLFEVLVVGALLSSILFALFTILPRFRAGQNGNNLFFFGDISHMSEQQYIDSYMSTSDQVIKSAILSQIHAKSFIVIKKFQQVRLSLLSLLVAVSGWAGVTVLPIFLG